MHLLRSPTATAVRGAPPDRPLQAAKVGATAIVPSQRHQHRKKHSPAGRHGDWLPTTTHQDDCYCRELSRHQPPQCCQWQSARSAAGHWMVGVRLFSCSRFSKGHLLCHQTVHVMCLLVNLVNPHTLVPSDDFSGLMSHPHNVIY